MGRTVPAQPRQGWERAVGDEDSTLLGERTVSLAWTWLRRLQKPSVLLGNKDNISFQKAVKQSHSWEAAGLG